MKTASEGCEGYWTETSDGREFDCHYGPDFDCEDCLFGPSGEGKDPRIEKKDVSK